MQIPYDAEMKAENVFESLKFLIFSLDLNLYSHKMS